jgi:hypothetical protein
VSRSKTLWKQHQSFVAAEVELCSSGPCDWLTDSLVLSGMRQIYQKLVWRLGLRQGAIRNELIVQPSIPVVTTWALAAVAPTVGWVTLVRLYHLAIALVGTLTLIVTF